MKLSAYHWQISSKEKGDLGDEGCRSLFTVVKFSICGHLSNSIDIQVDIGFHVHFLEDSHCCFFLFLPGSGSPYLVYRDDLWCSKGRGRGKSLPCYLLLPVAELHSGLACALRKGERLVSSCWIHLSLPEAGVMAEQWLVILVVVVDC